MDYDNGCIDTMRKLRHTKGDGHKKIGGDCLKLQVRNEPFFSNIWCISFIKSVCAKYLY